jgi:hypothetical protein
VCERVIIGAKPRRGGPGIGKQISPAAARSSRYVRPSHSPGAQILNTASFERVHIAPHVIYAVLSQKALDSFIECTSVFVGAKSLSITLKLGLERSIEHMRSLYLYERPGPLRNDRAEQKSSEEAKIK